MATSNDENKAVVMVYNFQNEVIKDIEVSILGLSLGSLALGEAGYQVLMMPKQPVAMWVTILEADSLAQSSLQMTSVLANILIAAS